MITNYYELRIGETIQSGDEKQAYKSTKWYSCPISEIGGIYNNEFVKVRRSIDMFKTKEDQTAVKEILNMLNKAHNTSFSYDSRQKIVKILEIELKKYLFMAIPSGLVERTLQLFDCEVNDKYEVLIQCVKEAEEEQEKKRVEKRIVKMLKTIREHHHQAATFIDKPGFIKVKSGDNCESDDGWEFIPAKWDDIYNWLGY